MNEDAIINKLIEHDQRFDHLEDKLMNEIGILRQDFLDGQDKMMKILVRLDEERVFTNEAMHRMQNEIAQMKADVARHEETFVRWKQQLNIA